MLRDFLTNIAEKDVFAFLSDLTAILQTWADTVGVHVFALYGAGIALALVLGLLGYKLGRFVCAILAGATGYYLTGNGMVLLSAELATPLPKYVVYIVAACVGVVVLVLSFVKHSYVFCAFMALLGFSVTFFYMHNPLLSLAAAIVLALLCALIERVTFILVTSVIGAAVGVSLASAMLPQFAFLRVEADNWIALAIIVGIVVLLFVPVQFLLTRHARTPHYKTKRDEHGVIFYC